MRRHQRWYAIPILFQHTISYPHIFIPSHIHTHSYLHTLSYPHPLISTHSLIVANLMTPLSNPSNPPLTHSFIGSFIGSFTRQPCRPGRAHQQGGHAEWYVRGPRGRGPYRRRQDPGRPFFFSPARCRYDTYHIILYHLISHDVLSHPTYRPTPLLLPCTVQV